MEKRRERIIKQALKLLAMVLLNRGTGWRFFYPKSKSCFSAFIEPHTISLVQLWFIGFLSSANGQILGHLIWLRGVERDSRAVRLFVLFIPDSPGLLAYQNTNRKKSPSKRNHNKPWGLCCYVLNISFGPLGERRKRLNNRCGTLGMRKLFPPLSLDETAVRLDWRDWKEKWAWNRIEDAIETGLEIEDLNL